MSGVQLYIPTIGQDDCFRGMSPDSKLGGWVKHTDHARALAEKDAEIERLGEALKLIAASAPEAKPERLATLPSSPRGHVGFGEVAAMSYDLALWEAAEIARAALAPRADGGEG